MKKRYLFLEDPVSKLERTRVLVDYYLTRQEIGEHAGSVLVSEWNYRDPEQIHIELEAWIREKIKIKKHLISYVEHSIRVNGESAPEIPEGIHVDHYLESQRIVLELIQNIWT
jgi:hypothetical protein